jgi:hypothetical protein
VEDSVEGVALIFGVDEKVFNRPPIRQLSLHKFHSHGQQIPPAMAQIVKNYGLMSLLGQQPRHGTTYVPRTACYQDLHKKDCPFPNALD